MVVWWWVLVYTGGKEASERGKRKKEKGCLESTEDRKYGACIGMTGDGMGQAEGD